MKPLKMFVILFASCGFINAQSVRVKLMPHSYYYKDSTKSIAIPDTNFTYIVFKSLPHSNLLMAEHYSRIVYINVKDVVATKAFKDYMSKYFLTPYLSTSLKVTLKSGTKYYLDTINNDHKAINTPKNATFIITKPARITDYFFASYKGKPVYVCFKDIQSTEPYRQYYYQKVYLPAIMNP